MKKVLVTGAAGFIGFHLCKELIANNHEVVGLDNLNSYYDVELKQIRLSELQLLSYFTFVKMDLINDREISNLVAEGKFDAIYNLAAQAGVRLKKSEYQSYIDSNIVGFSNILNSAIEHGVQNFLYASSSSVYGNGLSGALIENKSLTLPTSFYGSTKLFNENIARTLVKGTKTRSRGLRFFTVYGPYGRPDMAYFRIASSLLNNSKFTLFGDGTIERDFTFVGDVAVATMQLCSELSLKPQGYSDIVNIGGGKPVAINSLISKISDKLGAHLSIINEARNPSDVAVTHADTQTIYNLIKFIPQISLDEGLDSFLDWARKPSIRQKLQAWTESAP